MVERYLPCHRCLWHPRERHELWQDAPGFGKMEGDASGRGVQRQDWLRKVNSCVNLYLLLFTHSKVQSSEYVVSGALFKLQGTSCFIVQSFEPYPTWKM